MDNSSQIGRVYAEALFELAKAGNKIGECYDNLEELNALYQNEKDFRDFFASPLIDFEQKVAIVREIFEDKLEKNVLNLLFILIKKHRETALNNIFVAFRKYRDEDINRVYAEVVTADEPNEETLAKIKRELSEKLNKDIIIEKRQNPKIIGGLIIKVGDKVIDASVINKLRRLRKSFKTFDSQ